MKKIIRVVSPSSSCEKSKILKSKQFLEMKGFEVELSKNIFLKNGYLAGSDEERSEDLKSALLDKNVDIIWMSRGGYGSIRLLQSLKSVKPLTEKTLIGYSDSTALFCLMDKAKNVSILYGPSFSEIYDQNSYNQRTLFNSLLKKPFRIEFSGSEKRNNEIKIFGGCLSVLVSLIGTPFFPDLEGKYLLLEDVNEPMYRLDRMATQLKLGGIFDEIEGLILGSFKNITGGDFKDLLKLMSNYLGNKPLLINKKIGHCSKKLTIPFNVNSEWDGKNLCFF